MLWRLWQLGVLFCIAVTGEVIADYESCKGQTRVNLGYRLDDFHWSIGGTGGVPNVLSELKWERLHMIEASVFSWHSDPYSWIPYIRWSGTFNATMRGKVTDEDFALNNRCGKFSRAEANCYRGAGVDLNAGLGVPLRLEWCGFIQVAPLMGIGWCQQHFHMHDGHQKFSLHHPEHVGPINGLRSEYLTHWWGPWAGLDAFWEWDMRWAFNGGVEYHWNLRYRARGDWNLRPEFEDGFYHRADHGHAWVGRFGIEFAFDCFWLFCVDATVRRWSSGSGDDRTRLKRYVFEAAGNAAGNQEACQQQCQQHRSIHTPFNGAHWDAFSVTGGLVYRY